MLAPAQPPSSDPALAERPSAPPRFHLLTASLQLLRPHQWTKNAFCLAGVFFSDHFRYTHDVLAAFATFACFCTASSAAYLFNDLLDRERDRQHPVKCRRPVASGAVSVSVAAFLGLVLAVVGLAGAYVLGWAVFGCLALYLVNNLAYS